MMVLNAGAKYQHHRPGGARLPRPDGLPTHAYHFRYRI